jgi:uncharacterized protein YkwD
VTPKSRSGKVFLIVCVAAFFACSTEQQRRPISNEYNEEPAYYMKTGAEKQVEEQILKVSRDAGVPDSLRPDNTLSAAARNLTMLIKEGRNLELIGKLENEAIKKNLTDVGVTDNAFRSLVLNVIKIPGAQIKIKENLEKDLQAGRFTHFGVGVTRIFWPPTQVIAIILTRKAVVLNSFPKSVLPGQEATLSGHVLGKSGELTVLDQDSNRTNRYHPGIYSGGLFSQSLSFDKPGTHQVEVMLETDLGPEVVALFPVTVEGKKPAEEEQALKRVNVSTVSEGRQRLLQLINDERKKRQLMHLSMDENINKIAQKYAEEMMETGVVAHISPKSGDCADRAKAAGLDISRIGENIAVNQSVEQIHESLLESPAHREVMLDPQMEWVGLGVVFSKTGDQVYVVENFVKYWKK